MSTKKTFSQIRLEQAINLIVDGKTPILQISIRCPYCGDSRNPGSTHLGVKFGVPSVFNCFICDTSGVVNTRFLKDMRIDREVIKKWAKWSRNNRFNPGPNIREISFNNNKEIYDFKPDVDSRQYKYMVDRFGVEFTDEDIERYRIILDPIRFIRNLKNKEVDINTNIKLQNYIGFLSQDGNQATFRAIYPNVNPRYYNLAIQETDYRKLYVLDTPVDIKAERFNFILTEGVFDLIGVYEKFYKGTEATNNLYVAALGKSFTEPLNRLIRSGFLDFNILLYADSSDDVNEEFLETLFKNEYIDEILLIQNAKEGEKDFGVDIKNIEPIEKVIDRKVLKQLILENKKKD